MTDHVLEPGFQARGTTVSGGSTELGLRLGVASPTVSHWLAGIVGSVGQGRAFQVDHDEVVMAKLAVRAAFGRHAGCGCEQQPGDVARLVARADRTLEAAVRPEGWLYLSDQLDDVVATDEGLAELVACRPHDTAAHAIWLEVPEL